MTKTLLDNPELPGQPSDNAESVSSGGRFADWLDG